MNKNLFLILATVAIFSFAGCLPNNSIYPEVISNVDQPEGVIEPDPNFYPGELIEDDEDNSEDDDLVMCTADAKMCPDGSFVGRIGPKCEFAACPNEPVIFENHFNVLKTYAENNIIDLVEADAVLGGTWYVTEIEDLEPGKALVKFEDGHIDGSMELNYKVEDGKVNLLNKKVQIN